MPWEDLAKWALAGVISLLTLLGLDLRNRVKELEKGKVTREDFDELRKSMMATFVNGHTMLDKAIEQSDSARVRQHEENREMLQRMQDTIEANETRSANTRHDIQNTVHALALHVAVLRKKSE